MIGLALPAGYGCQSFDYLTVLALSLGLLGSPLGYMFLSVGYLTNCNSAIVERFFVLLEN
jgi:hypothetical protein